MTPQLFAQSAFGKSAEAALEVTHVRVIDVAVDDVADSIAAYVAPQAIGTLTYVCSLCAAATQQKFDFMLRQALATHSAFDDSNDALADQRVSAGNRRCRELRHGRSNAWQPVIGAR